MDKSKPNGVRPFPLVIGAFFCEKLLLEGAVPSAIRIVDLVQIPPVPPNAKKTVIWPAGLLFVVMLRAGAFRGKGVCEVYMENPSGKKIKAVEQQAEFAGPSESGFNIQMPAAFKWDKPGLYWFDIYFNKKRLARSPLQIKVAAPPAVAPKEETKKPKS